MPADNILLTMLKTDLGVRGTSLYDTRFMQLLTAAQRAIINEGAVSLDDSDPLDQQLIVMYAGWLWRKRDYPIGSRQNMDATVMPRSLRLALNNRVFRERAAISDD